MPNPSFSKLNTSPFGLAAKYLRYKKMNDISKTSSDK